LLDYKRQSISDNKDIHIRVEMNAGRITLNRPDKFNALTYEMILAIEVALLKWQDDERVKLVIIDANGEKAFCAGGDIQKLYQSASIGDFSYMQKFWWDEYRLNALIANYPKPYIAFMHGITMGGGVGVSAHGSHRITSHKTMLAMPECAIGLSPDVGGSFLLAKAPGHVGELMGITGARLNGADAIHAGFADYFVDSEKLDALKTALISTGKPDCIADFGKTPQAADIPCTLEENANLIETYFSADSALAALHRLEESNSPWAQTQAKLIRRASPLAAACTFKMLQGARSFGSVEQALVQEYRFTSRSMQMGDVIEGVRALIIDKDNKPDWRVKSLEQVTDDMVSAMLAPLGKNEWTGK
jgi:enoyl-CoA hydratase